MGATNENEEILRYLYKQFIIGKKAGHKIVDLVYCTVKEQVEIQGEHKEFLFFLSRDRKDFVEQFNSIYSRCNEEKSMLKIRIVNKWNLRNMLQVLRMIFSIHAGKKLLRETYENYEGLTVIEWICICMMYARYEMYRKAFKRFDFRGSKFLVTYGEWMPEVAAILYANSVGMTTIVNAQALCSLMKRHIYPNYPRIAFLWGENDAKLVRENRPYIISYAIGHPQMEEIDAVEDAALIGIVLGIHANREHNQRIIDIAEQYAEKYSMKVLLRLHPGDNIIHYRINTEISSIGMDLNNVSFIIVHRTTMFASYLRQGKKVYAYEAPDQSLNLCIDSRFFFHDLVSLEKTIIQNENFDTLPYASQFIARIGQEAENAYKDIFHRLHMGDLSEIVECGEK